MSRYRDYKSTEVRLVHLDVLELRAPGRQTMTVIGMDVQNGLSSDFCFPGIPSHVNRSRVMQNCLTYPGYTEAEPPLRRLSEEPSLEIVNYERNAAANRAARIIEDEELKKQRAARADKLIEEEEKNKKKAVKKKVKKQKQRERKRCEKLEKEDPNTKHNNVKVTDSSQQSKGEKSKDDGNSTKDQDTLSETLEESLYFTASDEDSEQEESDSGTSEELDMSSSFVSTAASAYAKRKLEQKEKKKNPVKEETQLPKETQPPPTKEQSNEVQNHIKENTLTLVSPRKTGFKDNIQTSTEFAVRGNTYASSGQFDLAINYFTEAIKYNPTEYKLFGNRSFCFEKMQEFEKSLTDAEVSLTMCPGWVKGLYRKGRALAGLRRYKEAAKAFKEVLKLDSSCVDAAQELMRVQITQLMGYGFTREQSSNALIIHGTVDKALEVLSELHCRPGAINNESHPTPSPPLPPAETKNITSVSPVPLAATSPSPRRPPPSQEEPKQSMSNKPLAPAHKKPNVQTRPNPNPVVKKGAVDDQSKPEPELFPIWVGNVGNDVTEDMLMDLFSRAGVVYSVKCLHYKRCAFVNFTNPNSCKGAIQQYDGYVLKGITIVVRYPDRTPRDMGIAKTASTAHQDNSHIRECYFWRNIGCTRRATCNYRHIEENYRIDFGKKRPILEN